jgi:hypothetical protein
MRSRRWLGTFTLAAACYLLAPPGPILAGSTMLTEGFQTLYAAPLEAAVSPYVAADTLASNMESQHYSTRQKVAMAAPGFVWLWMAQIGMAGGRVMAGLVEIPLGLVFLPLRFDPAPLLNLDNEPALVEHARPPLRFGIYFARRD